MFKQQYACFLHPQRKSDSLKDHCPDCELSFEFPLVDVPAYIAGRAVRRPLNRGFYGAVYEVEHTTIKNRRSAIKVLPVATYAPKEAGGYGKDFGAEAALHHDLSEIDLVARLLDAGESEVVFGTRKIQCHWLEMEYVRGPTLKDLIATGPDTPRIIAQIAYDLFDVLEQLQQRGTFHNDLHADNIKVVSLDRSQSRSNAIAKNVQTKILDLGSVADESKSSTVRLSDIHQVANHILELTAGFERRTRQPAEPNDQRIVSRLRQVAQQWCAIDAESRRPRPHDLKASIVAACSYGIEWWMESPRVDGIAADINAVTMPSHRAHVLFCGPDRWRDSVIASGTTLLTGMRGCGKTMLLRSIHWQARIYQYDAETAEAVVLRIRGDRYLGLFVSCATLLRGPRPTHIPELVMHRLFLAFALEAVHFVQTCELRSIGTFDGHACDQLSDLVQRVAPWFSRPNESGDLYALEAAILSALNNVPADSKGVPEMNPREAFEDLTACLRSWGDITGGKHMAFLLDDVSVRYMSRENVETILKQLCFQSGMFSFKLSTETQTLALHAPGEKLAQIGRDYRVFDLGDEVFAILRDRKKSCEFFTTILKRRIQSTTNLSAQQRAAPGIVLGRRSLIDIARTIFTDADSERRRTAKKDTTRKTREHKYLYWGLDTLVALCVGDLGDIIMLYERMIQHVTPGQSTVKHAVQHKELLDFSEARLKALAVRDPWLYAHAVAFAQASNRELLASKPKRLRQYAEVDVTIGIGEANALFPLMMKLVDEGVFVATGATSRVKAKEVLQFKLAFRKVLGLTHRIPLSMRDRFELHNSRLDRWLKTPTSTGLESVDADQGEEDASGDDESAENDVTKNVDAELALEFSGVQSGAEAPNHAKSLHDEPLTFVCQPELLHTVTSAALTTAKWGSVLKGVTVIAAIGFEDRSVGAWRQLLRKVQPKRAILLRYPDPCLMNAANEALITELLKDGAVETVFVDVDGTSADELPNLIYGNAKGQIAIDVTSMTKSVIYHLVRSGLMARDELAVLHTCAQEYFPLDSTLANIAAKLTVSMDQVASPQCLKETFDEMDKMVTGEKGPYQCVQISKSHADPSQPVFLAMLMSLKHEPIRAILEEGAVERSAFIYPMHSAGDRAHRSVVGKQLAEFLGQMYHGDAVPMKSLDHAGVYEELRRMHQQWCLKLSYNFELGLAGTKMHTVGAGMFASVAMPSAVYYSKAQGFDVSTFTQGTGATHGYLLRRREVSMGK